KILTAGKAANSREYGRFHSVVIICFCIKESQNLSNSVLSSDSVGSIIKVPATGQLMVGAWKP
ncbi:hypothetical protein ALC57_15669, partial [Trachymyrmex cornetzi]